MPYVYDLNSQLNISTLSKEIYADTNVIADMFFDKASIVPQGSLSRMSPYHRFIQQLFQNNIPIYITTHTLLEMQHVFLKFDFKIYSSLANSSTKLKEKQFRSDSSQMQSRKPRYQLMYQQITQPGLVQIKPVCIEESLVSSYINTLDQQSMDTNDFVLVDSVNKQNHMIITDDQDFASSFTTCDILTYNTQLISKALSLGFILG